MTLKIGRIYKLKNHYYCSIHRPPKQKTNLNDTSNEKKQSKFIKEVAKNYGLIDVRCLTFLQFAGMHCSLEQQ